MGNQSLTRNFALGALGIPTCRVGDPDFVAKNEVGCPLVLSNAMA